jgi:hypothetical protein
MFLEDGWVKRRVALAAKEFDSWPESFKDRMRLNGPEPDKNKALAWLIAENDRLTRELNKLHSHTLEQQAQQ